MIVGSKSNITVLVLLGGILLTLIALVLLLAFLILTGGSTASTSMPERKSLAKGETAKREELPHVEEPMKPIGDPNLIQQTAVLGATYKVSTKFSLESRVEDRFWGVKEVVNLTFVAEMRMNRTIEQNNGKRIVELREFETLRSTKLESKVDFGLNLGLPGDLILGVIEKSKPGEHLVLDAVRIMKAIGEHSVQTVVDNATAKAWGHVSNLMGKKVRITYVDGVGVLSVEAVDCELTPEETEWVFSSAVLSDYYVMPDLRVQVGKTWTVDGRAFAGMIDPELKGATGGDLTLRRLSDFEQDGKPFAKLKIDCGYLLIKKTDPTRRKIGEFTPLGTFDYSISERMVQEADLQGEAKIEEVSTDHLLFETAHKVVPRAKVLYHCEMIPPQKGKP